MSTNYLKYSLPLWQSGVLAIFWPTPSLCCWPRKLYLPHKRQRVIVQKIEPGVPDCHIIQFSEQKESELRGTLRKPKCRHIHRSLYTADFPGVLKSFGAAYADVIAEPDICSHTNSVLLTEFQLLTPFKAR